MNIADLLLLVLLGSAFASSCYLLRNFFLTWKVSDYHIDHVKLLSLPWLDFIIFLIGFILCYSQQQQWVILYSIGFILTILLVRRYNPFSFWNLQGLDFPSYLWIGLKVYLTIFIPFALLTAGCTYLFTLLGFKEINQPAVELFMRSEGFGPIVGFLIFACVVAPVWEEITFRGFLYPFLKSKMGKTAALILSSLLFAAMHQHVPSFIPLTFLGILLALLYERKGGLGYAIMLHSFFNLSTCVVLLLLKYGSNPHLWKSL
jgi:uncharacterized protein